MGQLLYLICNKNKKHEKGFLLGTGMLFPRLYTHTIKKIKKGKYGEEMKKFLEENPKGAINCNSEIVRCPKCGKLEEVLNLSMYVPRKNNKDTDNSYVSPWELRGKYKKVKEYKHICPKCSTVMKKVKIKYNEFGEITGVEKLKCPKCDGVAEWDGEIGWWD